MVWKLSARWRAKRWVALCLVGCLLLAGGVSVHAEVTEDEFVRLHKLLTPAAEAAWRTVPWKIELLEAQKIAARDKLPIFIWAMDGHPLGCT